MKEGTSADRDVRRGSTSRAIELAFDGLADGVFHLAGQPGVRQLRYRLRPLRRRNVLASARASRPPHARPCASSSLRRRPSTATLRRTRRPRRCASTTDLAVRRDQARVRAPRVTRRTSAASTRPCLRYFTVYGPRQRPDMALQPAEALSSSGAVPAVRRRVGLAAASRSSATPWRRPCARWTRGSPVRPTTSAAATRRRWPRRWRCPSVLPGGQAPERRAARGSRATFAVRTPMGRGSRERSRRGCRRRRSTAGLKAQWEWAAARVAAR